jgi:hypothetical protein
VFVFISVYLCPIRLPYQMMFVSFNSSTTGANGVTGTAYKEHMSKRPYWLFKRTVFQLYIHEENKFTKGVTGTAYPSRLHELTPDFYYVFLCSVLINV